LVGYLRNVKVVATQPDPVLKKTLSKTGLHIMILSCSLHKHHTLPQFCNNCP